MVGSHKATETSHRSPGVSARVPGRRGIDTVLVGTLVCGGLLGLAAGSASAEPTGAEPATQNAWGRVLYRVAQAKRAPAASAWALRALETGIARTSTEMAGKRAPAARTSVGVIDASNQALATVPVGERFPAGPGERPQEAAAGGLAWSLPVTDSVPPISDDVNLDAAASGEREVLTVLQSEFLRKRGQLAAPVAYARQRTVTSTAEGPALLFETTPGTKVLAAASGRVAFADGPTHRVILEHGEGYYTVYSGISECSVRAGDLVGARSPLGLAGSGGLTFQVRSSGSALDPLIWLGLH